MFFIRLDLRRLYPYISSLIVVSMLILPLSGALRTKESESSPVAMANADETKITVILDPGHGGVDSGTVGDNGTYEKDLNLIYAETIGKMLEENGFEVLYTRNTDALVLGDEAPVRGLVKITDLKNRCKIADDNKEAVFLSIHMNSFTSKTANGLQVYYSVGNGESQKLAAAVRSEVKNRCQPDNKREIKEGKDIYILENVKSTAILIEFGFLSNPTECENLCNEEYRNELSFAVVCGIVEYVKQK